MGPGALTTSPGARAFYDQHRAAGDVHHQALRALGNRLVGILHGCLRHHSPYNEHTAWAHRHASSVLDNLRPWDVYSACRARHLPPLICRFSRLAAPSRDWEHHVHLCSERVTRRPPSNPLSVGANANDAPRSDVGKVVLCEFVVGVVMEDY